MSYWDNNAKEVEVGNGAEWPDVPDDLYEAVVQDVSEPETGPDRYNPGKERTTFYVNFELTSGEVPEGTILRYYIPITEGFSKYGLVSEKSKLYGVLEAFGYDLGGRLMVDPRDWQGRECRVMVENKENAEGEMRPRITQVKAVRQRRPAPAAKQNGQVRQPVAAGASRRGGAPFGEDDEAED